MCTCIKWTWQNQTLFGRTLDAEFDYGMDIIITPRNYNLSFRYKEKVLHTYAMIGMAKPYKDYPLYADAMNEKGLCMAGLEFPKNATYYPYSETKENVCPYEFISFILRQCANVSEAKELLKKVQLTDTPISSTLALPALHWMISDKSESIVVESTERGLEVYPNVYNVLTNNPNFSFHKENINNYLSLTSEYPDNRFCKVISLTPYSYGMGSLYMPGDYSSPSRFVKAAFTLFNSKDIKDYNESIHHFFHMEDAVSPLKGVVLNQKGLCHYTIYSSCMDMKNGIYYFKSYWNNQITGIHLFENNLDATDIIIYKSNLYQGNIKFLN